MYVTWTLATLAVAGYGLASAVWQLMLASLAFNALETAGTIVWATAKQRHVPAALLGRVSSLDWLISIGLLPLSFALTGPVSGAIGAQNTLIAAGLLGAVVTFRRCCCPGCARSRAARGRSRRTSASTRTSRPLARARRRLSPSALAGRPRCRNGAGASELPRIRPGNRTQSGAVRAKDDRPAPASEERAPDEHEDDDRRHHGHDPHQRAEGLLLGAQRVEH